jgi:hypothetical protein
MKKYIHHAVILNEDKTWQRLVDIVGLRGTSLKVYRRLYLPIGTRTETPVTIKTQVAFDICE